MYKLPHFEQLSHQAAASKRAHCSIRCQPLAQIQATGDAPLSLGAESHHPLSHPVSSSLPLFLPLGILELQMLPWVSSSQPPVPNPPPLAISIGALKAAQQKSMAMWWPLSRSLDTFFWWKNGVRSWSSTQINYPGPLKEQSQQDTSHTFTHTHSPFLTYLPFTLH